MFDCKDAALERKLIDRISLNLQEKYKLLHNNLQKALLTFFLKAIPYDFGQKTSKIRLIF